MSSRYIIRHAFLGRSRLDRATLHAVRTENAGNEAGAVIEALYAEAEQAVARGRPLTERWRHQARLDDEVRRSVTYLRKTKERRRLKRHERVNAPKVETWEAENLLKIFPKGPDGVRHITADTVAAARLAHPLFNRLFR